MTPKIPCFVFLVVSQWAVGAKAVDIPSFGKLILPPYPFVARLTGTEGTVKVDLTLDPRCNVTNIVVKDGPDSLVTAVTRALYADNVQLRLHPCSSTHTNDVGLSFIFSLRGLVGWLGL
jgi:hypothetical protein